VEILQKRPTLSHRKSRQAEAQKKDFRQAEILKSSKINTTTVQLQSNQQIQAIWILVILLLPATLSDEIINLENEKMLAVEKKKSGVDIGMVDDFYKNIYLCNNMK
jgi:hypothetical protein